MILTCSLYFYEKRCDSWSRDITTCVKGCKPEEGGQRENEEEEVEEEQVRSR